MSNDARWYVVHTYSGYENKVKTNLDMRAQTLEVEEYIYDVVVPIEQVIEIKDGKRKMVKRKLLPGYVMVKMEMTNETWFVVRNTRGVPGFVGAGNKPTPLSETDFASVFDPAPQTQLDIHVGDNVRILSGLFENFTGRVTEIDEAAQRVKVVVPMLKRETDVDLAYDEVIREE